MSPGLHVAQLAMNLPHAGHAGTGLGGTGNDLRHLRQSARRKRVERDIRNLIHPLWMARNRERPGELSNSPLPACSRSCDTDIRLDANRGPLRIRIVPGGPFIIAPARPSESDLVFVLTALDRCRASSNVADWPAGSRSSVQVTVLPGAVVSPPTYRRSCLAERMVPKDKTGRRQRVRVTILNARRTAIGSRDRMTASPPFSTGSYSPLIWGPASVFEMIRSRTGARITTPVRCRCFQDWSRPCPS